MPSRIGTSTVCLIYRWFLFCSESLFDTLSDQAASNAEETSTAQPSIWIFMAAKGEHFQEMAIRKVVPGVCPAHGRMAIDQNSKTTKVPCPNLNNSSYIGEDEPPLTPQRAKT